MEEIFAHYILSCGITVLFTCLVTIIFYSREHLKKNMFAYFLRFCGIAFMYNSLMFATMWNDILANDQFIINYLLVQNVLFSTGLAYGIYYIKPA